MKRTFSAPLRSAPHKRQARLQLQNDENEFSLQTKLKVKGRPTSTRKRAGKIAHQIQRCAKLFFTSALQPVHVACMWMRL